MYAAIIIGIILSACILSSLYFKEKCESYEYMIQMSDKNVIADLDSDWYDFKTKAGLSEVTGKNIKKLWQDIVKDSYINSFRQIATLRLTLPGLFKYPVNEVEAWMARYRNNYVLNLQSLRDLKSNYKQLLNKPKNKIINALFSFPHIDTN